MPKEKIVKLCDYIIEYGLLAIVFFIPIIIDFTANSYNAVDLYKIIFFRAALTFMLLAFLAKVFIIGRLSYRGSAKIFLFTSLLLLSFFISSWFSLNPNQSFWGNYFRQQGFYNFFHYLLFFVLAILNIKDFKQIKRLIMAVILAASLAAVYGLIQFFNLDPISWQESASSTNRIFSTLGQPNWFGHYLVLVLPFSLYGLIFLAKRFWARFFFGLAALAQLICLILTYSRAAWLGFFGSMVFLLLAWLMCKRRKKMVLGFLGLLLIGLIMIIGLNGVKPAGQNRLSDTNLINRLESMADFKMGGSNKMRFYYLKSSVKIIKQGDLLRLLAGYGPETLASVFIKYYQPDWGIHEAINGFPDRAHNWLFDQILALGVLGLLANLAFYSYLIYKAAIFFSAKQKFRPEDWLLVFLFSSLTAYCINNFFSFSLFTVLVYLYLILAICWLIINYQEKEKEINIKLTVFSKVLIWSSLLAMATVFIWTNNINQVRAEIYYLKAIKSINLSDCRGVINNLAKTISLSPNSNYYQEQYLFLLLNCLPSVDKTSQRELGKDLLARLESVDNKELYGIRFNVARAYTLFGLYLDKAYFVKAEEVYNGLIKDFPYLTIAYEDLGRQKMWQEDYQGVIETYKRALQILPPLDDPYLNNQHRAQIAAIAVRLDEGLGQAYFKMKNYELALAYYKKGLKLDPYRATLYKNIADIYYIQGRLAEAIAWNRRGLTLNPADFNWPLALSLLYRDKKDLIKAKEYLNQALKLAPENGELKKYEQELTSN